MIDGIIGSPVVRVGTLAKPLPLPWYRPVKKAGSISKCNALSRYDLIASAESASPRLAQDFDHCRDHVKIDGDAHDQVGRSLRGSAAPTGRCAKSNLLWRFTPTPTRRGFNLECHMMDVKARFQ